MKKNRIVKDYLRKASFSVGLETQIVMRGIFIPGRWRDKEDRGRRERGKKKIKNKEGEIKGWEQRERRERDEKQQAHQRH